MIGTNNKIRNENPASTGSLAGSKRFFSTFHLYSTRLMQQVRDQVFDKKSRKHVANPHELVENLAANLVENQVCSQVCSWLE